MELMEGLKSLPQPLWTPPPMSGMQQAAVYTIDNTNFCRVQYCYCILLNNLARKPLTRILFVLGKVQPGMGTLPFRQRDVIISGLCGYWKSWETKWDGEATQRWWRQGDITTPGWDTEPDAGAMAGAMVRHHGSIWHHGGWGSWVSIAVEEIWPLPGWTAYCPK